MKNLFYTSPKYLQNLKGINSSASEIDAVVKLGKLRNSKQLNLFNTPINTKATITSVGTDPSYTGYTNVVPVNYGYEYSFTANTINGSNILTNVSNTTGLVVGQILYQAQESGYLISNIIPMGATIVSIDNLTQITISKPCLLASTGLSVLVSSKNIDIIGGTAGGAKGSMFAFSSTVTNSSPKQYSGGYAIEFMTDAANFSTISNTIIVRTYRSGTTPNSYKVAIDDVYQSTTPQPYAGADAGVIQIQFLEEGIHKIRIEFQGGRLFQRLNIINGAKIWKPINSRINACFFGDSYFQIGEASYSNWDMSNTANMLADSLGWKIFNSSVRGTGYISNGGLNFNWQSTERLNDTTIEDFDAIVLFGSVNDQGATSAEIKAAALIVWEGIRLRNPNTTMFIFGVPTTVNTVALVATTLEIGMNEAFTEWGDTNAYFFPITTDKNGAWFNSSNVSTYMGVDGTHPNNKGVKYLSAKMTDSIKSVLN